jgi:hypothetical protein
MFIMGIWIFFDVYHGLAKNGDTGPERGRGARRGGGTGGHMVSVHGGDSVLAAWAGLAAGAWVARGMGYGDNGSEGVKVPGKLVFC